MVKEAIYIRTLKPSLNKDGDHYITTPKSGIFCWGHACAKHVNSAQINEEPDWMVGESFGYFL